MKDRSRSKTIAILSAVCLALGFSLMSVSALGLLPIFIVVISLFMMVIHGWLYLSGSKSEDVFDEYQAANKTRSSALKSGLNSKEHR